MILATEWYLIGGLLALGLLACVLFLYPLRQQKAWCLLLLPILVPAMILPYSHWGGYGALRQFFQQQRSMHSVQEVLKTIKSPQDLIDKFKTKLTDDPKSAQGWYLLGRLYSAQNDLEKAFKAFAKAYGFKPNKEEYAVEYAHTAWQLNHQQFTLEIRTLLQKLLNKNPNQPDALSMLAMDCYLRQDYAGAIQNWQALLKQVPVESKEARALRRAIAKAYSNGNKKNF